jgi:hypothetical protein
MTQVSTGPGHPGCGDLPRLPRTIFPQAAIYSNLVRLVRIVRTFFQTAGLATGSKML